MDRITSTLEGLLGARFISNETAERRDAILATASEQFAANAKELFAKGDIVGADVLMEYSLNACPCQRTKAGPCPRCTTSRDVAAEIKARLPVIKQQTPRPPRKREAPDCPPGF